MTPLSTRPRPITRQILAAVLVPVIFVTVAIITYYSWQRYQDIEANERLLGELGVGYLAAGAELAIYAGDTQQLKELARIALRRPAVARVCFLDSNARVLVKEGQVLQASCAANLDTSQLVVRSHADSIQFTWPITRTQLQVIDFEADELEPNPAAPPVGWVVLALDNQNMLDAFRDMLASAVLLGLAGILTGVLFALRAGDNIGGPVRALTRHVRQLDSQAPNTVFPPAGTEETITLANGLNQLVESVNRHIRLQEHRIDSATASLVRRNRELEETHRVLEQALQTKSDFLARMSHELRTPLTTIIGFNRLLMQAESPLQRREYSRHIEHASVLLQSIIEDILDYSRLQSAALQLETLAFKLHDCFEDVVGLHGYEAIERRLELVLLIDNDVPRTVIGDALRLKQVVNNLLANAIKFTEQGEVVVHLGIAETSGDAMVLQCEVRDTGIGINADHQNQVFQPFTQADNSISRKYGGTGLGLAICESLVQLMGGQISLSSDPGQGTRVVFAITVERDNSLPAEMAPATLADKALLAYEGNTWANRALGAALETWSNNITLCDSSAELLLELEGSSPDLLYLGLSHAEVKQQPLLRMLKRIRTRFKGPIILLSAAPDLVQRIAAGGLSTAGIELAPKPLRRQSLANQSSQLLAPDAGLDPGTTEQTATLAGLRVLVAEDHQSIRELLRLLLSRHGAKVTAVADGQQAMQACADDASYDLLLVDLHMPHLDGLRVINLLRQQGNRIPIICLTADVTVAERQALSWAGADAILLKPIDEVALLRAICEHCQRVGAATIPRADTSTNPVPVVVGEEAAAQLQQQLLQTLEHCRQGFESGDTQQRKTALHDLLGLAGVFREEMLYALVREIADEADSLSAADACQLLDDAEQLIRKY